MNVEMTFAGLCGVAKGCKTIPGVTWAVKENTGVAGAERVVFGFGIETHRITLYTMNGKAIHEVKRTNNTVDEWVTAYDERRLI